LPSQKQNSFEHKVKIAANKEILKRWAETVNCHYIETRFCAKPMDKRDAGPFVELVDKKLML
jgi:hypothetical protein